MTDLVSLELDIRGQKTPGARKIGWLADRQHGVVAHWQLVRLGFGRNSIQHGLSSGRLYQLYRGVYAVGHTSLSWRGRVLAAVLACGVDAVASHQSAGMLEGVRQSARAVVDVTVPGRSRRSRSGIAVHAVRVLHPDDRTIVDGIPVTSIPRTLLDLAEVLQPRQLRRTIEDAEKLRVLDLRALERLMARSPGRRGLKPLRAVLAEYVEAPITRSELERLFAELLERAGIERPQMNVIVAGREVDAVWHAARLIVELDSRTHHMTTAAFEEDRRRDADLMLAGYRVLRITWRRLRDEPEEVAATVRELLAHG
jgi:very-short-patch-repair endonuclease